MGRKGKTQNHTAKEIAGKHAAAKYAAGGAGGGSEMQKQREAEKIKSMVTCEICKMGMPVRLAPPLSISGRGGVSEGGGTAGCCRFPSHSWGDEGAALALPALLLGTAALVARLRLSGRAVRLRRAPHTAATTAGNRSRQ